MLENRIEATNQSVCSKLKKIVTKASATYNGGMIKQKLTKSIVSSLAIVTLTISGQVLAQELIPAGEAFRISKPLDLKIHLCVDLKENEKAPGNITLPSDYVHTRLQGIDSAPGEITKEGGLRIRYEIGKVTPPGQPRTGGSFTDRAKNLRADQRAWFKTTTINEKTVNMAYTKDSILLVSFPSDGINFSVKAVGEEQLAEALMIILSYP